MSSGSIRRAQLVAPFGVGAMSVLVDGTSVITAGLDHWYPKDDPNLALEEFVVHDWRLEARLKVAGFRLPPDFRSVGSGKDQRNVKLTVPVLRFPRWCFCMYCKRLKLTTLSFQDVVRCGDLSHEGGRGKGPRMAQVPFVAICESGHVDDFPFDKWVHRSRIPHCTGVLRLFSTGGGGLEGQVVRCGFDDKGKHDERLGCGESRTLQGITMGGRRGDDGLESTVLTENLAGRSDPYRCSGARPWLHEVDGPCDKPIRGALRAAGNVYFPRVESSIFLPQQEGVVTDAMRELLKRADVGVVMEIVHSFAGPDATPAMLRKQLAPELFDSYSDEQLLAMYHDRHGIGIDDEGGGDGADDLTSDDIWRYPEFKRLRETPDDDALRATDPGIHADLSSHIGRVRSVRVLQETRALRGFTRGRDGELKLPVGKAMLRRRALPPDRDWLPAYVVKGEGIYLELDPDRLAQWEAQGEVQARADMIAQRHSQVITDRGGRLRDLSPRFVMLHTLGHLLINELVFTSGYSSASLRERLYVSQQSGRDMAGLLIYTAAGDSEGTMGGLVRMARQEHLRAVFASALSDARWCSTDPVCMDAGEKGQGPDSCNLAACHGCALLPETSCEEFNRFLDRGLVIGTFDKPTLGFFSDFAL
ncbi:DrmB family protein [Streptomyces sp. NPDC091209]|uniref:DrmB family protein n=1 Tax=Streptomyces sp. NPDC091209 TaxID=3365974 RepID=UPI00381B1ECF